MAQPQDGMVETSKNLVDLLRKVEQRQRKEVEAKLEEVPELVNQTEGSGRGALHIASYSGDSEMIVLLLSKGAEVDKRDFDGLTPLCLAAKKGRDEAIRSLVKGGAEVNAASSKGVTALHHAAVEGNVETLDVLRELGAQPSKDPSNVGTPLHWASSHKNQDIGPVASLLDAFEVPINAVDEHGGTALHHTVSGGFTETVIFLLERGADPNVQAKDGATPLHLLGCVKGDSQAAEIAKQLLLYGAELKKDNDGETPIDVETRAVVKKELERKNSKPEEYDVSSPKRKEEGERFKASGNKVFAAGEYNKGARLYTRAIANDPGNHVLFSNRSACHFNLRRYPAALADANHCISLKPDWAKGYFRRGAVLASLGRLPEAVTTYEKGLKIDPKNVDLTKGLAEIKAKQEKANEKPGKK